MLTFSLKVLHPSVSKAVGFTHSLTTFHCLSSSHSRSNNISVRITVIPQLMSTSSLMFSSVHAQYSSYRILRSWLDHAIPFLRTFQFLILFKKTKVKLRLGHYLWRSTCSEPCNLWDHVPFNYLLTPLQTAPLASGNYPMLPQPSPSLAAGLSSHRSLPSNLPSRNPNTFSTRHASGLGLLCTRPRPLDNWVFGLYHSYCPPPQ